MYPFVVNHTTYDQFEAPDFWHPEVPYITCILLFHTTMLYNGFSMFINLVEHIYYYLKRCSKGWEESWKSQSNLQMCKTDFCQQTQQVHWLHVNWQWYLDTEPIQMETHTCLQLKEITVNSYSFQVLKLFNRLDCMTQYFNLQTPLHNFMILWRNDLRYNTL